MCFLKKGKRVDVKKYTNVAMKDIVTARFILGIGSEGITDF